MKIEVFRATNEVEEDILREVKYNRKQLMVDLETLKNWLIDQKHLPETKMKESDEFLIQYLVGAKGSMEKVKRKLDSYYTLRSFSPLFQERDNIELQKKAAKSQFVLTFPELLPDGCPVMMCGGANPNVDEFDPLIAARHNCLAGEYILRSCGIVRGVYILVDATDFSSGHALKTSPTILRSLVSYIQEAMSSRVRKYIIFNAPTYAGNLVNMAKPFISQKLRERIIVTSESIEKVFDFPHHLPEDYGGKYPSVAELAERLETALMNWHYLPNLEEKVDESLRPRKDGEFNPYFGLHGSIKTLVID